MKIAVLFTLFITTLGCVSTSKHKTNEKSEFYVKNIGAKSLEDTGGLFSANCPKNDKDIDTANWNTMLEMANDCVKSKSWKSLSFVANRLSIKAPLSPWGPYYLSIFEQVNANYDKSHWLIDLALKKTPNFGMLYYQKSRIYWDQGLKIQSITFAQKALTYDNRIKSAHLFLANLYINGTDYERALKHYSYLNSSGMKNKNITLGLAECYYRLNNLEQAQVFLKKSLSYEKNNFDLKLMYAESLEVSNDKAAETLSLYKELFKISVKNSQYKNKKDHLKMKVDQFSEKLAQLEAAKRDISSADKKGGQK